MPSERHGPLRKRLKMAVGDVGEDISTTKTQRNNTQHMRARTLNSATAPYMTLPEITAVICVKVSEYRVPQRI